MQCNQKFGQKKWSHISSQKTSRTSTHTPSLLKCLLNGAIVLKEAIEPGLVTTLQQNVGKLLSHDLIVKQMRHLELQNKSGSFYNTDQPVKGVRIRKGTQGRFEFKSVDRRDGGELVHELQLPESVEPLLLPPVMKRLLSSSMHTPWRIKAAGIITSFPGAAAQAWHRDTGDGLFGEAFDLRLPDYI